MATILNFNFKVCHGRKNWTVTLGKRLLISAIQKWLKKSPYNNWKHLYYQPKGLDTVKGNEIHYKIADALAKSVGGKLLTDFENGYHIKRK